MTNNYRVLLYYKYTPIENPEKFRDDHLAYCKNLGILGRILVSSEGINGTLSGTIEQTENYMKHLTSLPGLEDVFFKMDTAEGHAFKKMHVRVKNEIVNLSLEDDINPLKITGNYLEPVEFYKKMQDPNTVIIDARNDYEYDLGHFRGAVKPDIKNFRDLPNWIRANKDQFENKEILTYCTGGVRCEKFSGWLISEGFNVAGQLHGGIHHYGTDEKTQGKLWDGKMYVFDERIAVDINKHEHVIVGKDYFTGEPCERYINCGNPECNKQILASEANEEKYLGSCSHACRIHPNNRYIKKLNLSPEYVIKYVDENLKDMYST